MYINLKKEVLVEGIVVERSLISLTCSNSSPELIEYFTKQGYVIVGYTLTRLF